jgi:hypothetical protein
VAIRNASLKNLPTPRTNRKEYEMTRSTLRPLSGALLAFTLSAATLLGPFALAPANAAAGTGYYRATLAAPLAEPRKEILSGVVWNCDGAECGGTKSGSRAVIVCGRLAGKLGEVASFSYGRDTLDAGELATCNKG